MRPLRDGDEHVLVTGRLRLSQVTAADTCDLVLLHGDANVAERHAGPWTAHQARDWAAMMATRWARHGVGKWMARLRSDGTLVGRGGLSRIRLEGQETLELGWTLRDAARGQGYATEIGRAGLRFAVEQLGAERVVAFTEVHNRASRAVMERLGMHPCGVIFRPGLVQGQAGVQDDAPFALYAYERSA